MGRLGVTDPLFPPTDCGSPCDGSDGSPSAKATFELMMKVGPAIAEADMLNIKTLNKRRSEIKSLTRLIVEDDLDDDNVDPDDSDNGIIPALRKLWGKVEERNSVVHDPQERRLEYAAAITVADLTGNPEVCYYTGGKCVYQSLTYVPWCLTSYGKYKLGVPYFGCLGVSFPNGLQIGFLLHTYYIPLLSGSKC